jgi:hypothetical protein
VRENSDRWQLLSRQRITEPVGFSAGEQPSLGIPILVKVGDSAAYGFVLIQLRVGRCVCSVALLKFRLTPSRLR